MALSIEAIETMAAALTPYIDDTGLHVPEYVDIKTTLESAWRGIYGSDIYLEPDSQDGQLIAVFALALLDTYQAMEQVYQGFSPSTASGETLSRVVKMNGIRRQAGSYSTADVTITGTAGTTITNGIIADVAGQKWDLPATVVIPSSGQIVVTATAQDEGEITAQAGQITKIMTPTRGWQTVTNAAAATVGAATETDAALRLRQAYSVALPSSTILEGTLGAVLNVDGVSKATIYENDTNSTDANGIPAHSISVVAQGGSATDIARAIWLKKTPGCGTYGTTSEVISDSNGIATTINFYRPTVSTIEATVTIAPEAGYVAATAQAIKQAVADYVNALAIGADVSIARATAAAITAGPAYDVSSVTIGTVGGAQSAANLVIPFNGLATCDVDDITVVTP